MREDKCLRILRKLYYHEIKEKLGKISSSSCEEGTGVGEEGEKLRVGEHTEKHEKEMMRDYDLRLYVFTESDSDSISVATMT